MTSKNGQRRSDDSEVFRREIVQLARLGMAGRPQDVQVFVQRLSRRYRSSNPELADELAVLTRQAPTRSSPLRDASAGMVQPSPVDTESRLDLVRHEFVVDLPVVPIWTADVAQTLEQLIAERKVPDRLAELGLSPTRTVLLTGLPGVGKTLAARYLASQLGWPLLILDLAAVMSSLLGRTGSNVRRVMDYAKERPCILLLDEFDAVAKRRDDVAEIGELKRLVTVLLQTIDDWPSSSLLLCATNHPDLLDPAVWRRFEAIIDFPLPNRDQVRVAALQFLGPDADVPEAVLAGLVETLIGESYSSIERDLMAVRRRSALAGTDLSSALLELICGKVALVPLHVRAAMAAYAVSTKSISQRGAQQMFQVSRDVIRREARASAESTSIKAL